MATVAFDAKRAFANTTGLGNYSRSLIDGLSTLYPAHDYLLLAPHTPKNLCAHLLERGNIRVRRPKPPLAAIAGPIWRRYGLASVLKREKVQVYHGLSHELPLGIEKASVFSVVTIHDMLPFRHPELFKWPDRAIYQRKLRHACLKADMIIAVSEQTRKDIFAYLDPDGTRINQDKVEVIHQSCAPAFCTPPGLEEARNVAHGLGVEGDYILYVGSVIERKNLLSLVKGMELLARGGFTISQSNRHHDALTPPCSKQQEQTGPIRQAERQPATPIDPKPAPLVRSGETRARPHPPCKLAVVGTGRGYMDQVKKYVSEHGLEDVVIFLGQVDFTQLPHLYRAAKAFVYPSMYEGFGIPIIEAQHCLCPVITSTGSCFPEAGGPHSIYVETRDNKGPDRIARAIKTVLEDAELGKKMVREGIEYVKRFDPEIVVGRVMGVYERRKHVSTKRRR